MRKYAVLAAGAAVMCPAAFSMLTACGSSESPRGEVVGTQPGSLAASDDVATGPSREDWKRAVRSTRPPKAGCFSISYPANEWQEVQCAAPPSSGGAVARNRDVAALPNFRPATPGPEVAPPGSVAPGGGNAGAGTDWFAHATGSSIQDVVGSFPATSGLTQEWDPEYNDRLNAYCLQINSNFFSSPVCGSYSNCYGWQQFEYSSTQIGGVFMEYWLFNYPPAGSNNCPSGWSVWVNPGTQASASTTCHQVSDVNPVPVQAITNLGNLVLNASANDPEFEVPLDLVWLETAGPSGGIGTIYAMNQDAATLSLYQNWSQVEFNVVGDWNGTEAMFSPGSSITVQAEITPASYPGGTWLSCSGYANSGTTAEFNDLTLSSTCSSNQGSSGKPTGYIQFTEKRPPYVHHI
jgi:hypothetical protein